MLNYLWDSVLVGPTFNVSLGANCSVPWELIQNYENRAPGFAWFTFQSTQKTGGLLLLRFTGAGQIIKRPANHVQRALLKLLPGADVVC